MCANDIYGNNHLPSTFWDICNLDQSKLSLIYIRKRHG